MKRLICLLSAMLLCVVMAISLTGCFGGNLRGEWEYSKFDSDTGVKTTTIYCFIDGENYIRITETKHVDGTVSRSAKKGTYEILDYTNHGPELIVFCDAEGNNPKTYQFFKYSGDEFALGYNVYDGYDGYSYEEMKFSKR